MYLLFLILFIILIVHFYFNYSNLRIERIKKFTKPGDYILDLGCGDCCLTSKINNVNIINVDVVDKSKCSKPILYNGRRIPLPDKSVDVSICAFVLHHTNNQAELLLELKRVTKRVILIFEDTPEYKIDDVLVNIHGDSHWGKGSFHSNEKWEKIFNHLGMNILVNDKIGRLTFPFSGRPWLYPVQKRMYVLKDGLF